MNNPVSCTRDRQPASSLSLWTLLTFATLMLYRSVLRQAKIRKLHVLRVVIYSAAPIAFIGPLLTLIWLINDTGYPFFFDALGWLPTTAVVIYGLLLIMLGYRVVVACRTYLGLPLLTFGAILTQILVALAMIKLYMVIVIGWW